MTYLLKLLGPAQNIDEVSESFWALAELKVQGIEESPADDSSLFRPGGDFEIIEFGTPAAQRASDWLDKDQFRGNGKMILKVYCEIDPGTVRGSVQELSHRYGFEVLNYAVMENRDYLDEYRKNIKGSLVAEKLWVGPPWLKPPAQVEFSFFVEAGLAFGTGEHPTTQFCLVRLYEYFKEKRSFGRILDLGTGTGVLALAAKRFFPHAEVVATDLDPDCRESLEKTFQMNGCDPGSVKTLFGDEANAIFDETGSFDLVISNIYAEVLEKLCPKISSLLKPKSIWLSSGILEGPAEAALLLKARQFFDCRERRTHLRPEATDKKTDKKTGDGGQPETWVMLDMQKF